MAPVTCLRIVAAAVIGFVAWQGFLWAIPLSIVVPCLIGAQPSRPVAGATAFAYYGAATWPLISAARAFTASTGALPTALWLAASLLLTLPWLVLWASSFFQLQWRIPLALLLSALPPLGLIGWASPLTSAGVLFPGLGWFGLAATTAIPAFLAPAPTRVAALCAVSILAAITNLHYSDPGTPPNWAAVDTSYGRRADGFEPDEQTRSAATGTNGQFVIFPEGTVRLWTEATDAFWQSTSERLGALHKTALIGAGLPISGSAEYRNGVVIVGMHAAPPFLQRIPVPLGMWKPFGPKDGVPLHLRSPGTAVVGGQKVAFLICYEQLLVWPVLQSALEHPTILVGQANESWTKQTNIPAAQKACLKAWSRLFGIPVLSAVNS